MFVISDKTWGCANTRRSSFLVVGDLDLALDTQQQILIEQRVTNDAKSPVIAYLLLVFLGGFGAHRFYLGKTGTAVTILILWVLGWVTAVIGVGLILLLVVGIWAFVDLFLIPGMIKADQQALRQKLAYEMGAYSSHSVPTRTALPVAPSVTG